MKASGASEALDACPCSLKMRAVKKGFGFTYRVKTYCLRPPKLLRVKWRHVGLWTGLKGSMAKPLRLQAQSPVSIKDEKRRPVSQTNTPAGPWQSMRLVPRWSPPSASHTDCDASRGSSSMQHSARLPVTRPAWMTYRGPSMTQRIVDLGILIQALTAGAIPQQWQKALASRSTRVKAQQLQPDQPAEQSSRMVTTSQPGCPSSMPVGRHRA